MSQAAPATPPNAQSARRRHPRYQLAVPLAVTVVRPATTTRLTGRSQDVGLGGIRGAMSGELRPGERVELEFPLPLATTPFKMHAVVRHKDELEFGFEFLNLKSDQRQALTSLAKLHGKAPILNLAEQPAQIVAVPRPAIVICAGCGNEYTEDKAFCILCGRPAEVPPAPEVEIKHDLNAKLFRPSAWASAFRVSAHYYGVSRGAHNAVVGTVVALVFLLTLSIGVWQWLNAPAEDSQGSTVDIHIGSVLLHLDPTPPMTPESLASSPAAQVLSGSYRPANSSDNSLFSALVRPERKNGSQPQSESIGQPGSASAETPRHITATASSSRESSRVAEKRTPIQPTNAAAQKVPNLAPSLERSPTGAQVSLLRKVLPVYPNEAREEHVEGDVVLSALIAKDGTVAELRPLRGPEILSAAAMDAVRQWRFKPYEVNGKPVAVETSILVSFQLPK